MGPKSFMISIVAKGQFRTPTAKSEPIHRRTVIPHPLPTPTHHGIHDTVHDFIRTDIVDGHVVLTNGVSAMIRALVRLGVDMNDQDIDGNTLLHTAAKRNFMAAEELVASGADPEIQNRHGNTPIYSAALCGRADIVAMMLRNHPPTTRAGKDAPPKLMRSILTNALCSFTGLRDVATILRHWIDVFDVQTNEDGVPWITLAVHLGRPIRVVELLVQAGANVEHVDILGNRPMYYAAKRNRQDIVMCIMRSAGWFP